jgi:hypothetical protein
MVVGIEPSHYWFWNYNYCNWYSVVSVIGLGKNQRKRKMSKSNSSNSGGIGFVGLLTVLFIGLKLTNFIAWSWWWVLSPMLITLGLGLLALAVIVWLGKKQ